MIQESRFHELDHFGLPALDESLAFGFLEILVEFSHAKTMVLVYVREAGPKLGGFFTRENSESIKMITFSV